MHSLLEQQLKQFIGPNGPFPPGWDAFVKALDETYTHADTERMSLQHSLEEDKRNVERIVEVKIKQYIEEAARWESSINSLNIGIIMTNVEKKILVMNTVAKNTLLSNPSVQTHSLIENMFVTATGNLDISYLQHFFQNSINIVAQIDLCMKNQQPIQVGDIAYGRKILSLSLRPIRANQKTAAIERDILGCIIIIQDITDQRALERSKDEFFSIASHELRTPLTAIRGNTSLIQHYFQEKLSPELKEMVEDIHESSVRLIAIVNDFLDTSRLDLGKMQFKKETFAIEPLIQAVIKEYLTTGSMKKLYLQYQEPKVPIPQVVGDKERVKQVLINLVGNALKFTEVGGITISLHLQDKAVIIMVSDTGKGIPLASQSLLFRKFQQAGPNIYTRDDVRGTGLGLYISKMMVEGMGGKIWLAASEVGKGTSFAFSLPSSLYV